MWPRVNSYHYFYLLSFNLLYYKQNKVDVSVKEGSAVCFYLMKVRLQWWLGPDPAMFRLGSTSGLLESVYQGLWFECHGCDH